MSAVGDQSTHRAERSGKPTILRPKGMVVWLHFETADQSQACGELVRILRENHDAFFLLVTSNESEPVGDLRDIVPVGMSHQYAPEDTAQSVDAFLDAWKPDLCVWGTQRFKPILMNASLQRGIELIYVNADPVQVSRLKSFLPNSTRAILRKFSQIFAITPEAEQKILRDGVDPNLVRVSGPLISGGIAPHFLGTDRSQFAAQLAGRPTWFACNISYNDLDTIVAAQKHTARRAQRLLLIIGAGNDVKEQDLVQRFNEAGLKVELQSEDGFPTGKAQIFLSDTKEDDGLWWAIAPVCYLGSGNNNPRDPMGAAALGSAIISLKNSEKFKFEYDRLQGNGAMRCLDHVDDLPINLNELIAPDRAAEYAQAAWGVQSEGAEATDMISDALLDIMDQRMLSHEAT